MTNMLTDMTSVLALIISGLALAHTFRSSKAQQELTLRETELVRIQIASEKDKKKKTATSDVSARVYKSGTNRWRVRIYNGGPADATNVSISIGDDSFISSSEIKRKFPLKRLEKGHSVELAAMVHMQSNPKEDITLTWSDASGTDQERTVTLTI